MKEQPGSKDYRDPNLYNYHYNREDRLSKLPPELQSRIAGDLPKGFFRNNRTVTIIFVDLALIALVWFVFLPLIRTGASGRLEGYSFVLRGFSYGGNALISLKVTKDSEHKGLPPTYTAVVGLSSSNRTVEMQGELPTGLKGVQTLRTSLPLSGKTVAVVCTVHLGGKHLDLKARLRTN